MAEKIELMRLLQETSLACYRQNYYDLGQDKKELVKGSLITAIGRTAIENCNGNDASEIIMAAAEELNKL